MNLELMTYGCQGESYPMEKLEAIIKTEGMVKDIDYTIKDIY